MKNDGVSLVIWNGTLNGCENESGFYCENRINISCIKMNVDVFMCGTKKNVNIFHTLYQGKYVICH